MNIENRMAVEGQREQAERYSIPEGEYFEEYDLITFCDVNDCRDCPRYGDDCDGDGEEDEDDE